MTNDRDQLLRILAGLAARRDRQAVVEGHGDRIEVMMGAGPCSRGYVTFVTDRAGNLRDIIVNGDTAGEEEE